MKIKLLLILICVSLAQLEAASKILLVCGPSGVGKSTVIHALQERDQRFFYVKPYTTRPLREGEKDKVHLSYIKMIEMEENGGLIALNHIHGNYYATPRTVIDEAFSRGDFPVIDWPIDKVISMKKKLGNNVVVVYLFPESAEQLKMRLSLDQRDLSGRRLEAGMNELEDFSKGCFDPLIHLKVKNGECGLTQVVDEIYAYYLQACDTTDSTNQ